MNWNALIDPAFELELLNGNGLITEATFLICILLYLRTELRERGLGVKDWFYLRLPHHINFAVAVMVADTGVCIRAGAIWIWRRFMGSGGMPMWLFAILAVGIMLIIVGSLCKIRALSYPVAIGSIATVRPWVVTLVALCLFMAASILFR